MNVHKVAIIGPGALGCFFAVRLALAGVNTFLIDHDVKRAQMLRKRNIVVDTPQGTLKAQPTITSEAPKDAEFVLVLTKAYSTNSLRLPRHVPVLTLQNGLGNAECLADNVGSEYVMAGATSEAVTWLGPGHVRHAAAGSTVFGPWSSCPAEEARLILSDAGFAVTLTDAPSHVIWGKVIMNAAINPLTAILNVPNGALLKTQEVRELLGALVVEAVKVAGAEGYQFPHNMNEEAERLCAATSENISSMLQDIRNHKRTEIEAISGEILRRAQVSSIAAPYTQCMLQLVRGLETT